MAKFFYEMPIESKTGELLSRFWQNCLKCEQAADDYAKKMGAKTYFSDPRFFAGGVVCLSFPDDHKVDEGVWRRSGMSAEDHLMYWEPNCDHRYGVVEVPNKDYRPQNTFDTYYEYDQLLTFEQAQRYAPLSAFAERAGIHLLKGDEPTEAQAEDIKKTLAKTVYIRYVRYFRDERPGKSNGRPRVASRGLRKAIKAEVRRMKLPVMHTETLLQLLQAETPERPAPGSMPTFFPFQGRYYVGVDYPCSSSDLKQITAQAYTMSLGLMRSEARHNS